MINVLKKGLYTTIQDLGRTGFRKYGVPVSGAMDQTSALLANVILGNEPSDAVMEITLQGPELQFTARTSLVVTGANLSPTLNGESIEQDTVIEVKEHDVLNFGKRINGARSYLAVAGGFTTQKKLNSRSYYQGITDNMVLSNGDVLPFSSSKELQVNQPMIQKDLIHQTTLEVYPGPEFDKLDAAQQKTLLSQSFTIGMNNRMGYQLEELIENKLESILSSAVLPGTVQLTPSGKLIVLMRDCQTTGGYPRVLQLSSNAIDVLSQKILQDKVGFVIKEHL